MKSILYFKKTIWTSICLALFSLCPGCRKPALPDSMRLDPDRFNADLALKETEALIALGPRDSGTPGAEKAACHLLVRLQKIGVEASIDMFTDAAPRGTITFRNVQGIIPGTCGTNGQWIILGSHYDTKSGIDAPFQGANDSGSSTGLLLALADFLRSSAPLPINIMLVFFDGEECQKRYGRHDGLHGSRHFVDNLKKASYFRNIRAVLVLDMVGDRNLSITIPQNSSPELITAAFRAAETENVRSVFSLMFGSLLDDHVPFLQAGLPAINIIDFEYGSTRGKNDYWHTPEDTLDKLSAESLGITGRVIIHMLNELMSNNK